MESDSEHICDVCNRSFDNSAGLNIHKSYGHDEPYKDESTLREMYIKQDMSAEDIADEMDTSPRTIRDWMKNFGIELDGPSEGMMKKVLRKPATFSVNSDGYERALTMIDRESKQVYIHRLLAVAEYGFDSVCDNVVHHGNGIPWDNRPENIEIMSSSEHTHIHYEDLEHGQDGKFI